MTQGTKFEGSQFHKDTVLYKLKALYLMFFLAVELNFATLALEEVVWSI